MGATFQNRWEENQKKLYSKEAEEKAEEIADKAENTEVSENLAEGDENSIPQEENISNNITNESQLDLDSFDVENSEEVDIENAVNEKNVEEAEKKAAPSNDFELPDDVPDLSDLDSLLKEAGP